jgi:hypothetical protein
VPGPRAIHDYFYRPRSVDVLSHLHYAYLPGRKAQRCWPRLAWWLLDMCVINAFQLWSKGQQHHGRLRFREELMHQLLKQLPPEHTPRKRRVGPHPSHTLASERFSVRLEEKGDCASCSSRPHHRVRTHYACAACAGCSAHLCIGGCFAQYHP